MVDRIIRFLIISAVACAILASFTMRAHSATVQGAPCLKAAHHKHAKLTPVQSCATPEVPMCFRPPIDDTPPLIELDIVTRYSIQDAPIVSDDYSTDIGGYWWLSGPVGGDFAVGSVLVPSEPGTPAISPPRLPQPPPINIPPHSPPPLRTPEIDPHGALRGFMLLGGLLLVVRGKRPIPERTGRARL